MKDPTDEELLAAYQAGSGDAFRALYKRHSGKILGFLCSRTGSNEMANDLFQEVFVKIHRSKHLYNPTLPALPWLFSITRSVLIDSFRQVERRKESFGNDFEEMAAAAETVPEKRNELEPLLDNLVGKQRAALQLRFVEEKTFEEIAESLKTSPVNVRQIVSRAIKKLKERA